MKVKICGITNLEDAENAVASGADALGFVFAESPRRVTVSRARAIIKKIGPFTTVVGVFVNEPLLNLRRIVDECGLDAAQLHGDESSLYTKRLSSCKVIKAFGVGAGFSPRIVSRYDADAFLFDAKIAGARGGTGKSFDWKILEKMVSARPVIISGGLNAANVSEVRRILMPYAVDVSSAVERSPGKKDLRLLKEFIKNAKKN